MDLGLQGRRALVTGSSSGIGEGIAKALAKEGVNLIIHGRKRNRAENVARQVRELGVEADIVIADINQPDQVERLGTEALALGDMVLHQVIGGGELTSGLSQVFGRSGRGVSNLTQPVMGLENLVCL